MEMSTSKKGNLIKIHRIKNHLIWICFHGKITEQIKESKLFAMRENLIKCLKINLI